MSKYKSGIKLKETNILSAFSTRKRGRYYMKFNNKKTQRIISTVIAVILVLSFVLSYVLSLVK